MQGAATSAVRTKALQNMLRVKDEKPSWEQGERWDLGFRVQGLGRFLGAGSGVSGLGTVDASRAYLKIPKQKSDACLSLREFVRRWSAPRGRRYEGVAMKAKVLTKKLGRW